MRQIIGFEFQIVPAGQIGPLPLAQWVRLQGSGGEIGGGSLAALRDAKPANKREALLSKILAENLRRAKGEAGSTGAVRVWRDHEDPAQRITRVEVTDVRDCRPIYERPASTTQHTIKLSEAICCAMQLDDPNMLREMGFDPDAFRALRHGVKFTGTLDEIAKLADCMKRENGWDMSPQLISACNRRATQLETFVRETRAGMDF